MSLRTRLLIAFAVVVLVPIALLAFGIRREMNRRLTEEFGVQYRPLRQRVREVINDIRAGEGLPPVG